MYKKTQMIDPANALSGRSEAMPVIEPHFVNQTDLTAPVPIGHQEIIFGLGCFWGAERIFWQLDGVYSTSVGYSGGYTPNPTYREVCSGETGHTEVVRVIFNPDIITLDNLLAAFWEHHDPTQGMKQGNDVGTQYRSAIYTTTDEQLEKAKQSLNVYQQALSKQQANQITTEIAPLDIYYFAETYHQQYLARNPNGYCGIGGTGVCFPAS